MALVGRLLEAQGFRVGILAQPDWRSAEPFAALGRPTVMWGVTAGNMDSMVNRYTADRRLRARRRLLARRRGRPAARPRGDRLRAALPRGLPRRPARHRRHRGQPAPDRPLRLLVRQGPALGAARRQGRPAGLRQRRARDRRDRAPAGRGRAGRGDHATCAARRSRAPPARRPTAGPRSTRARSTRRARSSRPAIPTPTRPPARLGAAPARPAEAPAPALVPAASLRPRKLDRARTVVRCPTLDAVAADPVLYAHASRLLHVESNPGNARALVQRHGDRDVWLNPPPLPLSTPEMDRALRAAVHAPPAPALRRRAASPPTR